MNLLRILLLLASVFGFGWYAVKDGRFHVVGRGVPRIEQALHGALGLSQLALIVSGLVGSLSWTAGSALVVALLGALDEYIFHRAIPGAEADLHAKAHLALFIFVAIALGEPLLVAHAHR